MLLESGHVDMCMAHHDMVVGEGNAAAATTINAQDYHDILAAVLKDLWKFRNVDFPGISITATRFGQ